MINLVLKDIIFNKKQLFYAILISIGFSLIVLDDSKYGIVAILMIPSLLFSFFVGKMCSIEDNISVESFLKTLPIKKSDIVICKFVESYLMIILGLCIISVMNLFLGFFTEYKYELFNNINIYIYSIIIIYNSIFLFLNFKYSYSTAQQTVYVLFIGYMGLFALSQYIENHSMDLLNGSIGLIILGISFLISLLLCFFAIKSYAYKN